MSLAKGSESKCGENYMMLFDLLILDKLIREGPDLCPTFHAGMSTIFDDPSSDGKKRGHCDNSGPFSHVI